MLGKFASLAYMSLVSSNPSIMKLQEVLDNVSATMFSLHYLYKNDIEKVLSNLHTPCMPLVLMTHDSGHITLRQ